MIVLARIGYILMLVMISILMSMNDIGPSTWQHWIIMFAIIGSYIFGRIWKEKNDEV